MFSSLLMEPVVLRLMTEGLIGEAVNFGSVSRTRPLIARCSAESAVTPLSSGHMGRHCILQRMDAVAWASSSEFFDIIRGFFFNLSICSPDVGCQIWCTTWKFGVEIAGTLQCDLSCSQQTFSLATSSIWLARPFND